MTVKIIGGSISNCGRDGAYLGAHSNVEIIGTKFFNNKRNGVTAHQDSNANLVNIESRDNGEHGVYVGNILPLELGLPENIDIEKLDKLINDLKGMDQRYREQAIYSSFLAGVLAVLSDSSTIVLNILTYISSMS